MLCICKANFGDGQDGFDGTDKLWKAKAEHKYWPKFRNVLLKWSTTMTTQRGWQRRSGGRNSDPVIHTFKYDDWWNHEAVFCMSWSTIKYSCGGFTVLWWIIYLICHSHLLLHSALLICYAMLRFVRQMPHATYSYSYSIVYCRSVAVSHCQAVRLATMAASKQYRKPETASGNVLCLFGGNAATLFQNTWSKVCRAALTTNATHKDSQETGNSHWAVFRVRGNPHFGQTPSQRLASCLVTRVSYRLPYSLTFCPLSSLLLLLHLCLLTRIFVIYC